MVKDGRGVTVALVAVVGILAAGVSYLGLRVWVDLGHSLPVASWGGAVLLVFMAIGIYFAGLPVRRFVQGRARKELSPMRAMRTLVLAQAAALTGAAVFGWYAAHVLVLLPDLDVDTARRAAVRALVLCAASILLVVAGLLAQRMCRFDDKDRQGAGGPEDTSEGTDRERPDEGRDRA